MLVIQQGGASAGLLISSTLFSSLISFHSRLQQRLVKLKKLGRLFLEYKRLSGSLNREGRATGGLWLKRPTDLLGEEKNAWRLEKSIGDCRPLGGLSSHRLRGIEPTTQV
jgi:hypothetical protein